MNIVYHELRYILVLVMYTKYFKNIPKNSKYDTYMEANKKNFQIKLFGYSKNFHFYNLKSSYVYYAIISFPNLLNFYNLTIFNLHKMMMYDRGDSHSVQLHVCKYFPENSVTVFFLLLNLIMSVLTSCSRTHIPHTYLLFVIL